VSSSRFDQLPEAGLVSATSRGLTCRSGGPRRAGDVCGNLHLTGPMGTCRIEAALQQHLGIDSLGFGMLWPLARTAARLLSARFRGGTAATCIDSSMGKRFSHCR